MTRVDDGSDAQRIQEMNEADLRRKQDKQKRLEKKAVERSFDAIIQERRQKQKAQRETANQERAQEGTASEKRRAGQGVLAHIRRHSSRQERELARRAVMSNAAQSNMHKQGARMVEDTQAAESHRAAELLTRTATENEHVRETNREEEDRGLDAQEQRQTEVEQANREDGSVDADGRRQGHSRGREDGNSEDRRLNAGAGGATQSAGGAAPVVPGPLIQRLVSAIYKAATADGRTHLVLELKGGQLDGVRLSVASENGHVRCQLSGCDTELARGLERAKQSLARGLARRGLQLHELKVDHE